MEKIQVRNPGFTDWLLVHNDCEFLSSIQTYVSVIQKLITLTFGSRTLCNLIVETEQSSKCAHLTEIEVRNPPASDMSGRTSVRCNLHSEVARIVRFSLQVFLTNRLDVSVTNATVQDRNPVTVLSTERELTRTINSRKTSSL